jgi:predicted RNA-binding Zn-ribbon protein involved in translation (DUF1610 family)
MVLMVENSKHQSFSQCPNCGGAVTVSTHSLTGTKWKEYLCAACGWAKDVSLGKATWKVLEDGVESDKESKKE